MPAFLRIALFLLLALPASAAEDALAPPESIAGPTVADPFDFSRAVKPRPGDWLEYRIAFPVDPLENSLRADPAPTQGAPAAPPPVVPVVPAPGEAGAPGAAAPDLTRLRPAFDPPAAWRTVPLRLAIREVDENGCNAELRFAGATLSLHLPASGGEAEAAFHYDSGEETERTVRIGGTEYAVEEVRRAGSGYGFVRWFSPELPFGTVRFATKDVDMLLVGFGRGAAPDFPLRSPDGAAPALGSLY